MMNPFKVSEKSLNKKRDNYLEELIKEAEREIALGCFESKIEIKDLENKFHFLSKIEEDFISYSEYDYRRTLSLQFNRYLKNRDNYKSTYQEELKIVEKYLPHIILYLHDKVKSIREDKKTIQLQKFKKIDESDMSIFLKCFKQDFGKKVLKIFIKHQLINKYTYEFVDIKSKKHIAIIFGKLHSLNIIDDNFIKEKKIRYTLYASLKRVFNFSYAESGFITFYNEAKNNELDEKDQEYFDSLSYLDAIISG